MLDLTNNNHKRGVMILNSKDVRTVDKYLFDYTCNMEYIRMKLVVLEDRISNLEMDESIKKATLGDIDYMKSVLIRADNNIDKARDIFR